MGMPFAGRNSTKKVEKSETASAETAPETASA
jgi:hypothetical protein